MTEIAVAIRDVRKAFNGTPVLAQPKKPIRECYIEAQFLLPGTNELSEMQPVEFTGAWNKYGERGMYLRFADGVIREVPDAYTEVDPSRPPHRFGQASE